MSQILGMNARNILYCELNSREAKRFGFSKIRAKEFLKKHGIPVAELYARLRTNDEITQFRWEELQGGFAIKPSNGSAGKGVLVIKGRDKYGYWIDVENRRLSQEDLKFHSRNIMDGQYSTWGSTANVIIEERVPIHPDLEPYVKYGTPDVRVILFNKIPVISMIRLPTEASGGRANLDQGAIALGIDMGTGKTLFGVSGKKQVMKEFPNSHVPTTGIQVPFWIDVLKTAVRAANATGLRFMGADIFLHPEKGPMVAEVNAYPGLSIQLANRAGMRRRLRLIEQVEARNVSHAVRIGQSLFAENFATDGAVDFTVIAPKEQITIYGEGDQTYIGTALVNTGREMSAISFEVARQLGLADENDVLWSQYVEGGGNEVVVEVKYKLRDKIHKTTMVVSKRLNSQKQVVHLGRKDLRGFLVGVEREES